MPKKITIPEAELFNEATGEFTYVKGQTITLEHSLVSISKWEAKWKKSYISVGPETPEEFLDYLRCMTITQNVDPNLYLTLPPLTLKEIQEYMEDPACATTFSNAGGPKNKEIITAEIIYFWMSEHNISMECQKWHINRLLALIQVCAIKRGDQKKMSRSAIMNQNRSLNEQRKKALKTKG